jgi:hypothetical protein
MPSYHGFQLPDLTVDGIDVFSRSLCKATQNLRSLTLSTSQISPELFWLESMDESLTFPRLTEINVTTTPTTCSGAWLLSPSRTKSSTPTPDYRDESDYSDSEYEDQKAIGAEPKYRFRSCPDSQALDAFYLAVGKAQVHMPALKVLTVEIKEDLTDGNSSLSWYCFVEDDAYKPQYTPVGPPLITARRDRRVGPRVRWGGDYELGYAPGEELVQLWKEKLPGVELEVLNE